MCQVVVLPKVNYWEISEHIIITSNVSKTNICVMNCYFQCPLFSGPVSLLASCSCSAPQHFSILTHVSFLFVCSALWCMLYYYYHYEVIKSCQGLKRHWHHKGSGISSSGTQHSTCWNDICISKEADEMNRGTFTISDVLTPLVRPHPL